METILSESSPDPHEEEKQSGNESKKTINNFNTGKLKFRTLVNGVVSEKKYTEEWKRFSENTSLPGLSQITVSQTNQSKAAWGICILLSLVLFIIHFAFILTNYFQYKTISQTTYDATFEWPDITLCNLVPFSVNAIDNIEKSSLSSLTTDEQILKKLLASTANITNTLSTSSSDIEDNQDLKDLLLKSHNLTTLQHLFSNMILSCTFQGKQCIKSQFKLSYVPRFHYCYTFQTNGSIATLSDTEVMDVMLFLESGVLNFWEDKRKADFSPAGKIFVHKSGTYPNVEEILDLPTGSWVMIALDFEKKRNYERKCTNYNEKVSFYPASGEKDFSEPMDSRTCNERAMQKYLWQQCGCVSPKFRLFPQDIQSAFDSSLSCHYVTPQLLDKFYSNNWLQTDIADLRRRVECYNRVSPNMYNAVKGQCKSDCEEKYYDIRVSPHVWPKFDASVSALFKAYVEPAIQTKGFNSELLKINGTNISSSSITDQREFIQGRFLRLSVAPKRLSGVSIVESLSYSLENLLSEMGGILGLYLGFSIVFVYELIFLLTQVIRISLAESKNNKVQKFGDKRKTAFN